MTEQMMKESVHMAVDDQAKTQQLQTKQDQSNGLATPNKTSQRNYAQVKIADQDGEALSEKLNVVPRVVLRDTNTRQQLGGELLQHSSIPQTENHISDVTCTPALSVPETLQDSVPVLQSPTESSRKNSVFQSKFLQTRSNDQRPAQQVQVQQGQDQITLRVLPQNITVKPTLKSVPTADNLTQLPCDEIPVIRSSPQNTAIIIKRDGGGPVSNSTSAFVEEIVRRNGMKIVESQTRILLTADNSTPGCNLESGSKNQQKTTGDNSQRLRSSTQSHIELSSNQMLAHQFSSEQQNIGIRRQQSILADPQRPPIVRVSPPQCLTMPHRNVYPAQGVNMMAPSKSSHQRRPNQMQSVGHVSVVNLGQPEICGEVPVSQQPKVSQRIIPQPESETIPNPEQIQRPTISGINYIKVRLQEKNIGAQWIVLPRAYRPPAIKSPPLPRKQLLSRECRRSMVDLETQLIESQRSSKTSQGEVTLPITKEDGEEDMDTNEGQNVVYQVDMSEAKSRGDSEQRMSLNEPGITWRDVDNHKLGTEDKSQTVTDGQKCVNKSSHNITQENAQMHREPSTVHLQEEQNTSEFDTNSPVSSLTTLDSTSLKPTRKAAGISDEMVTDSTSTTECPFKVTTSGTPQCDLNMRITTVTTCTSTLTYASLSPGCQTTYTSAAGDGNYSGKTPDAEPSGQAVEHSADNATLKAIPSKTEESDNMNTTEISDVSLLNDYSGPVDMYLYLPEKAFKKGSVTFLSLQK